MKIISTFFLIIISSILTFAQSPDISWKVSVPEFIEENHSFAFSVFALFQELHPDSIEISLINDYIEIADSARILYSDSNVVLKVIKNSAGGFLSLSKELIEKIDGSPFQIIFYAGRPAESEVNFRVNFYDERKLTYSVNSSSVNGDGNYLSPAVIRVYDNFNSGKALRLKSDGKFVFPIDFNLPSQTTISFWANYSQPSRASIGFQGANPFDTLFSITNDIHNFPIVKPDENTDYLENIFLADSLWNFYEINFDNGKITLSINDEKVAVTESSIFSDEIKSVNFLNNGTGDIFISDIKLSGKKDFLNMENAGDSLLREINFENYDDTDSLAQNGMTIKNAELTETEIPRLAFPPQIDISISSAYSTIEWYNDKDLKIVKYVLQKSTDYKDFVDIYTIDNPEPKKRYSYQSYNEDDEKVSFFRVKQIDDNGNYFFSSQVKVGHAKIEDFELRQNYPNPFNPTTEFTVNVIIPGYYLIGIYDLVGKEIQVLHEGTLAIGEHTFSFNGEDLPSGIYLMKVKSNNMSVVRKMILAK